MTEICGLWSITCKRLGHWRSPAMLPSSADHSANPAPALTTSNTNKIQFKMKIDQQNKLFWVEMFLESVGLRTLALHSRCIQRRRLFRNLDCHTSCCPKQCAPAHPSSNLPNLIEIANKTCNCVYPIWNSISNCWNLKRPAPVMLRSKGLLAWNVRSGSSAGVRRK